MALATLPERMLPDPLTIDDYQDLLRLLNRLGDPTRPQLVGSEVDGIAMLRQKIRSAMDDIRDADRVNTIEGVREQVRSEMQATTDEDAGWSSDCIVTQESKIHGGEP